MRIVLFLIGFAGLFFSPWVPFVAGFLLAIRFAAWEVLILGLITDCMWISTSHALYMPFATLLSLFIVWICEPLRNEFLISESSLL